MSRLNDELDRHRAAVMACRRCGYGDAIQPIVSLARSPRAMLVGQAPGKVEAGGGAPFSGRAGKTLFGWFARVGLDEATVRSHLYIAAVTRCFPGADPSGRGDLVPGPLERRNCADWLDQELRIIRPRLVIPVGRLAIERFLGPRPLQDVVGRAHRLAAEHRGALVVPLPHPSGASSWIHVPANKALIQRALELIAEHWPAPSRRRVA